MSGESLAAQAECVHRAFRARKRAGGRVVALAGVSLAVERGEWVALLGPNGSGKTTLLRMLATIDRPDQGRVRVFGEEGASSAVRARLGVVFQNPGLDRLLTGRENLRHQGALFGMDAAAAASRIDELAGALGVADRLDDRVGTLSGGLARRVDLARALLPAPDLLLLDEATAGLDLAARLAFLDLVAQRRRQDGLSVVMTTHLMDEAERADRVVLLHEGRVVGDAAPEALRAELGEAALRCGAGGKGIVQRCGGTVREADGALLCAGEAAALREAAARLIDADIAFTYAPPTLGDVYLARTGVALNGEAR